MLFCLRAFLYACINVCLKANVKDSVCVCVCVCVSVCVCEGKQIFGSHIVYQMVKSARV